MSGDEGPVCPKCGSKEVTIVSSRDEYAITDPQHQEGSTGKFFVYRCRCGMAFTYTEKCEGTSPEIR